MSWPHTLTQLSTSGCVKKSSATHTADELRRNAALREVVAAHATAAAALEDPSVLDAGGLRALETLPIGWWDAPAELAWWVKTVVGWLITIAAVSLGVLFRFDLLGE